VEPVHNTNRRIIPTFKTNGQYAVWIDSAMVYMKLDKGGFTKSVDGKIDSWFTSMETQISKTIYFKSIKLMPASFPSIKEDLTACTQQSTH
jgi:hypothetical protein